MKASIIIPTHNRFRSLLKTLSSASHLKFPKKDCEIIIVENACTDRTKSGVIELLQKNRMSNFKLVSENSIGLHFARHTGAEVAKGDLLLFTDDDATFHPDWVNSYVHAFVKYKDIVAAGGPVKPKWETNPPKWLKEYIGKSKIFSPLSLMEPYKNFRLDEKGFFFGVNMAIRRKTLFDMGGFNPELIGDKYVGDGEFGLNKKLWAKNLLIGYIPEALVYHHVPNERMTLKYLKLRMGNEGINALYPSIQAYMPRAKLFNMALKIFSVNIKLYLASLIYHNQTDTNSLNIQLEASHKYAQIQYLLRLIFDNNLRSIVFQNYKLN